APSWVSATTGSRSRVTASTRSSTASTARSFARSRWTERRARVLRVEAFLEQTRQQLRVPLTLQRCLRPAHEEVLLLLADLVVAGAVFVDVGGVRGEKFVDHRRELGFVAHLREPAFLHHLLRTLRFPQAFGEHVLRLVARQRSGGDEPDELGEAVRRERHHFDGE